MSISPREKRLLGICAVVAVVAFVVIWSNLYEAPAQPEGFSTDQLQAEIEKFDTFESVFRNRDDIQQREKGIWQYLPSEKSAADAERILNFKIDTILKDHGVPSPKIQPSTQRSIDGIDEYRFLRFNTEFNGVYASTCDLLDAFDQNGFFIENLTISTPQNNPRMENIQCTVKITLSRLVKLSASELELVKRNKRARGLLQTRDKI